MLVVSLNASQSSLRSGRPSLFALPHLEAHQVKGEGQHGHHQRRGGVLSCVEDPKDEGEEGENDEDGAERFHAFAGPVGEVQHVEKPERQDRGSGAPVAEVGVVHGEAVPVNTPTHGREAGKEYKDGDNVDSLQSNEVMERDFSRGGIAPTSSKR